MTDPYERIAALAERELALVRAGEFEDLPALIDERRQIAAALPPRPPHSARPALERAAAVQAQITEYLKGSLAETAAELERLVRGRSAVRGYAAPAGAQSSRVDEAA